MATNPIDLAVPLIPSLIKTYMAVRRIEANGLGAVLPDSATEHSTAEVIQRLALNRDAGDPVKSFAKHAAAFASPRGVSAVMEALSLGGAIAEGVRVEAPTRLAVGARA